MFRSPSSLFGHVPVPLISFRACSGPPHLFSGMFRSPSSLFGHVPVPLISFRACSGPPHLFSGMFRSPSSLFGHVPVPLISFRACSACGSNFTSKRTVLNYPTNQRERHAKYKNNLDCEWHFNSGNVAELYLNYDIEQSEGCANDNIEIARINRHKTVVMALNVVPGALRKATMALIVFCPPNVSIVAVGYGDTVTVCGKAKRAKYLGTSFGLYFHTDSSVRGRGFTAIFRETCGGIVNSAPATFTSHNYPVGYKNRQRCLWVVDIGEDVIVDLYYNIEDAPMCEHDSLEIYNEAGWLMKVCDEGQVRIEGVFIKIVFTTDHSKVDLGFTANVTAGRCDVQ
ncbi:hypothetical protein ScPMuIL_017249 [Solemya velum]